MPVMSGNKYFNEIIKIHSKDEVIIASGFSADLSIDVMKSKELF